MIVIFTAQSVRRRLLALPYAEQHKSTALTLQGAQFAYTPLCMGTWLGCAPMHREPKRNAQPWGQSAMFLRIYPRNEKNVGFDLSNGFFSFNAFLG